MRSIRPTGRFLAAALCLTALGTAPLAAQDFRLVLPEASPRATVMQTIGLTDISVNYGRPGVNGRIIWDSLVPFDTVWRAGANINTVFTVTSPVTIAGQPLAAGRYGLFMIPAKDKWTVIFSKEANAWGHFSYAKSEDALRVTVTPRPSEMVERLEYTMDDPTDKSVTVTLRWEKLAVGFPVTVDRDVVVVDSLKQQLRNLARFFPDAWREAAAWTATNTKNTQMAEMWADSSINLGPSFANLNLKARLVERRGDKAQADQIRARAGAMASSENDINLYGYQLLGEKKFDQAIAVLEKNTKDHPMSWNTWDSLGEAYALKGDKVKARTNYQKALSMVTDAANKQRITGILNNLK
jgi:tetratricopeptide (TPR) repeat protein